MPPQQTTCAPVAAVHPAICQTSRRVAAIQPLCRTQHTQPLTTRHSTCQPICLSRPDASRSSADVHTTDAAPAVGVTNTQWLLPSLLFGRTLKSSPYTGEGATNMRHTERRETSKKNEKRRAGRELRPDQRRAASCIKHWLVNQRWLQPINT